MAGRSLKVIDWLVTAMCLAAIVGGVFVGWVDAGHGDDPSARPMLIVLLPLPGLVAFIAYRLGRRAVAYVLTGR
jgi:hypothetical protein